MEGGAASLDEGCEVGPPQRLVHMHVLLEGVAGALLVDQSGRGGEEREKGREWEREERREGDGKSTIR